MGSNMRSASIAGTPSGIDIHIDKLALEMLFLKHRPTWEP
jgi:hypothetical protein